MNKRRLTNTLIILLTIWCLILSILLIKNNQKIQENKTVNEINVDGFSTDFTKIVEKCNQAIVEVNSNGVLSTGFVYKQEDENIYILTSYHGVENGYINVCFGGVYNVHATLVGKDLYCDLAVLMIQSPYNIKPLELSDTTLLKDGEFVINIGSNQNSEFSSSTKLGMVSNNHRIIENDISINNKKIKYYLDLIQLSSELSNGYSGSPVLDMDGKVVGMITMKYNNDVTLAITTNEMKIVADKIISESIVNKYQYGIKGTYLSEMDNYVKSNLNINLDVVNGIYVEKLLDSSYGRFAGIKQGDIVTSINGVKINTFDDYLNASYMSSEVIIFTILRNNEEMTLTINLNA